LTYRQNLEYRDRVVRMVGGGLVAGYALARNGRPLVNDALFVLGVLMIMEGLHGYCAVRDCMGWLIDYSQGRFRGEG
jgi:hypothetical protein